MPHAKKAPRRAERPHDRHREENYLVTECPRCHEIRPHQIITQHGAWHGEGRYANWTTISTLRCSCGQMWTHRSTEDGHDG